MPACSVNTIVRGIPVLISVEPAVVCAGEEVTVRWNAGDGAEERSECRSYPDAEAYGHPSLTGCAFVGISSAPAGVVDVPLSLRNRTGSRTVRIDATTVFTVLVSARTPSNRADITRSESATVTVVGPEESVRSFNMEGVCAGARPVWRALFLRDMLSGCTAVRQICNTSSHTIRLHDREAPAESETLSPGHCTSRFNGRGRTLDVENLTFVPSPGTCGSTTTGGPPPSLSVDVYVACDRTLETCTLGR